MDFHFLYLTCFLQQATSSAEVRGRMRFSALSKGLPCLPLWPSLFGLHDGVIVAACDVAIGDGLMVDGFREAMGVKHCGISGRVALLVFIRFLWLAKDAVMHSMVNSSGADGSIPSHVSSLACAPTGRSVCMCVCMFECVCVEG